MKARQVTIESDQPVPVQLDGDVLGTTPATMEVVPKVVQLAAPMIRSGILGVERQFAR
ncbi:MAG: hypothetical protein ACKOCK_06170 [Chloroflexota bacterium]